MKGVDVGIDLGTMSLVYVLHLFFDCSIVQGFTDIWCLKLSWELHLLGVIDLLLVGTNQDFLRVYELYTIYAMIDVRSTQYSCMMHISKHCKSQKEKKGQTVKTKTTREKSWHPIFNVLKILWDVYSKMIYILFSLWYYLQPYSCFSCAHTFFFCKLKLEWVFNYVC